MKVPVLRIPFSDEDVRFIQDGVKEILASGFLSGGRYTARFEELFAALVQCRHAVSCSSGTSAIELIVRALEIEGESVVVPDNVLSTYYEYLAYLDDNLARARIKQTLREEHGVSLTGEVYTDLCHTEPLWTRHTYCGRRRGDGAVTRRPGADRVAMSWRRLRPAVRGIPCEARHRVRSGEVLPRGTGSTLRTHLPGVR